MPGLLLCFVLRYDAHRKTLAAVEVGLPPPTTYYSRITYFHCSLIGYFLGGCIKRIFVDLTDITGICILVH